VLNFCEEWWDNEWESPAVQAYCLCHGFAPTDPEQLVFVPDIFDADAGACATGFAKNVNFYESGYSAAVAGRNTALAATQRALYSTASASQKFWANAKTFCDVQTPVSGAKSVGPEYMLRPTAAVAKRNGPAEVVATPTAVSGNGQ
jgi:hypothetical protein